LETLPRSSDCTAVAPCVPITISSAPVSAATPRIVGQTLSRFARAGVDREAQFAREFVFLGDLLSAFARQPF
jgi:hypothetical protein